MKTLGYLTVTDAEFNLIDKAVRSLDKPYTFRVYGDNPFKAYKRVQKLTKVAEKYNSTLTIIEDLDLHYIDVEITDGLCAQIEKHLGVI